MKLRLPPEDKLAPLPQDGPFVIEMYARMYLIRHFETVVNELFLRGNMPGTLHLALGQEATVVGAVAALRLEDRITLTHRAHGQALAKGMDPGRLLAELYGKADGVCKGMGGSLHIGDMSIGALPAIAIVGASSPIATGLAFAAVRQGTDRVVCNFFGEGAANKGELHEAMNLASVWQLPVIFLCENNVYASTTHMSEFMLNEHVAERAAAYRMPGVTVDGNDPIAVHTEVAQAVTRARAGHGPSLVECLTYRRGGHKRDDPAHYRDQREVESWLDRDPVPRFRARLLASDFVDESDLVAVEQQAHQLVASAQAFAHASPAPAPESRFENVYAD